MLELAVARALYERYPDFSEGRLAKIRSHVVSRQSCAAVAKELDARADARRAGQLVRAGGRARPARAQPERPRRAARGGARRGFLEWGFEKVEPAIVAAFSEQIDYAATQHVDHKTELQETLARRKQQVVYSVLDVEGPAHDRRFTCAAMIDGVQAGKGVGRTKKEAEQEAAREALTGLASDDG